ncbi:MAG: hypothetical protein HC886_20920 [Leptolyngbyaceae cyanobacterium SM1_1_3]|nr:hypothetical protein [Leptolyngbyaceae cyanobacterium SM1_1_3]NJM85471.1 hypothetical protein [Leptolyngbyaceae cyanobacterium RM2_2_21]NJN02942.1 hypothetical protein [Leptolyngbyaceae cyanobacterium RM1_1_2]NJO08855.1 hypothetical protein [Leptolyngbyaceae cyanobacterium SL_1_1]
MKHSFYLLLSPLLIVGGLAYSNQPAIAQRLEPEDFFEVRTDGLMSDPAGEQLTEVRMLQEMINADEYGSFQSLQSRARTLAQSIVTSGFAEDPNVMTLNVTIVAERNGQQMPLLMVRVSRADWEQQPRVTQWARVFEDPAKLLLGYVPQEQQSTESTPRRTASRRSAGSLSSPASASSSPSSGGSGSSGGVVPGASIEESEYYQGDLLNEDSFEYR